MSLGSTRFRFRCCDRELEICGVLYCQQNGLNKACAQVALRSLCSIHRNPSDVSFRRINELAGQVSGAFDPSQGLEANQLCAVLDGFGIGYTDIDYNTVDVIDRDALAYQKFVYAGIESGAGALLGFKLVGPEATGHHIIPFFGHTFNRDMWVPDTENQRISMWARKPATFRVSHGLAHLSVMTTISDRTTMYLAYTLLQSRLNTSSASIRTL